MDARLVRGGEGEGGGGLVRVGRNPNLAISVVESGEPGSGQRGSTEC